MKQPELGRRISELRNAKGLTQEELVEKCNISVRTIQRIENGDVTPRNYTIKTIMEVLEYDLNKISEDNKESLQNWVRRFLFLDFDTSKSSEYLIKQLNIALIFGVIYFMLGFFEESTRQYRYEDISLIFSSSIYVFMKLMVLVSLIFFRRGFIMIGNLFKNDSIKILSIILIFCTILKIGYDIASLFSNINNYTFINTALKVVFGVTGIIYGFSFYKLQKQIGNITRYTGILFMIQGCFLLTGIFSYYWFIISNLTVIFEIIIIFKTTQIIKSKQLESNLFITNL